MPNKANAADAKSRAADLRRCRRAARDGNAGAKYALQINLTKYLK